MPFDMKYKVVAWVKKVVRDFSDCYCSMLALVSLLCVLLSVAKLCVADDHARTMISERSDVMISNVGHGQNATVKTRGVLCLTFDDRNFDSWVRCIPLFEKYDAHATFFVCGPIDVRAEKCMRRLSEAGHSIGLHGLHHSNALKDIAKLGEERYLRKEILPQLSVCRKKGLSVRSFAYPYSARSQQSDALLLRYFDRLRGGFGKVGDKSWGEWTPPFPVNEAPSNRVMMAMAGTKPRDAPKRIAAMMPQIAASNVVFSAYAHDIEANGAKHSRNNITEEDLEMVLAAAKVSGVAIVGFDELPMK